MASVTTPPQLMSVVPKIVPAETHTTAAIAPAAVNSAAGQVFTAMGGETYTNPKSDPSRRKGGPAKKPQYPPELEEAVKEYGVPPSDPARIQRAHGRIRAAFFHQPTPLVKARIAEAGYDIYYKCEHAHWTGSFKERGALNVLLQLTPEQMKVGVIAASAGNHALALAYHGNRLGIPVTVVMPTIAPLTKIERCQGFGARVVIDGLNIAESRVIADKLRQTTKQVYVNGFDHPRIVNGAGTCGIEIMEQLPDVEAIVVPVGGAGLIAGVAMAVKQRNPNVRVIGVESEACPSYTAAMKAGKPVTVDVKPTLADGLHVPTVGAHSFYVSRDYVDEVIVVREKFIAMAVLSVLENDKMVTEGAGACGVAAVLSGQLEHLRGMKTVVILCGGNIDVTALGRVIERGLHMSHRLIRFTTSIPDRPGGLAGFTQRLAATGASVKDIMQERPFILSDKITRIRVTIEAKSSSHAEQVLSTLRGHGYWLQIDSGDGAFPGDGVDHLSKL
jgi:threonine dehydratase